MPSVGNKGREGGKGRERVSGEKRQKDIVVGHSRTKQKMKWNSREINWQNGNWELVIENKTERQKCKERQKYKARQMRGEGCREGCWVKRAEIRAV